MKRFSKIICMVTIMLFALTSQLKAQVYVKVCPRTPVHVRPAMPHPGHVWIDGDWVYNGRTYVWREGYWAAPRHGLAWVPGHWKATKRGYKWVPGRWR
jgi:hypothetical protein